MVVEAEESSGAAQRGPVEALERRFGARRVGVALALALLAVTLLVRLAALGSIPLGFFQDEAGIGYNAYSILETGRDEHGQRLPVYFESFGDYKAALYVYALVPVVAVAGLSEPATRLPAVWFGTVTVLLTFWLGRRLFGASVGLTAALLLALCHWHMHFSRVAFEAIALPLFVVLAVGLVFEARRRRGAWLWVAAGAAFGLIPYAYATGRLVAPMMMALCAVAVGWRELRSRARPVALVAIVALVVALPALGATLFGGASARVGDLSLFGEGPRFEQYRAEMREAGFPDAIVERPTAARVAGFAWNYARHLSPAFLFSTGDPNPRHSVPGFGLLTAAEAPLLLLGVLCLLRRRREAGARLLLLWLALAPLPASLTLEGLPHAIRAINALPAFQLAEAVGLCWLISTAPGLSSGAQGGRMRWVAGLAAAVLVLGWAVGTVRFLHAYFTSYGERSAYAWQYGARELVEQAARFRGDYDGALIWDLGGPSHGMLHYVFPLFYESFPPREYLAGGRPFLRSARETLGERVPHAEGEPGAWTPAARDKQRALQQLLGERRIWVEESVRFGSGRALGAAIRRSRAVVRGFSPEGRADYPMFLFLDAEDLSARGAPRRPAF